MYTHTQTHTHTQQKLLLKLEVLPEWNQLIDKAKTQTLFDELEQKVSMCFSKNVFFNKLIKNV